MKERGPKTAHQRTAEEECAAVKFRVEMILKPRVSRLDQGRTT